MLKQPIQSQSETRWQISKTLTQFLANSLLMLTESAVYDREGTDRKRWDVATFLSNLSEPSVLTPDLGRCGFAACT